MINYLVCFQKKGQENQYHYFKNCECLTDVIHNKIFKYAIHHGYQWSSVPFPEELANKCMFTESDLEEERINQECYKCGFNDPDYGCTCSSYEK